MHLYTLVLAPVVQFWQRAGCALFVASLLSLGTSLAADSGNEPEGVAVHGHWTITVRNPDGAVVSRNEFNNSLREPSLIPMLWQGVYTLSEKRIFLSLQEDGGQTNALDIRGSTTTVEGNAMVLSGSATSVLSSPSKTATIDEAWTIIRCEHSTLPTLCPRDILFTARDLRVPESPTDPPPTPIQIADRQVVDVRVVISFGPAH